MNQSRFSENDEAAQPILEVQATETIDQGYLPEGNKIISSSISTIKDLLVEQDAILSQMQVFKGAGKREGRLELFEAIYYEFVLRQKDIRRNIENIQLNDEFREKQTQKVSEQHLELNKEVKTLKQMQKIRTYRQRGNFEDDNESAPNDDEVYDMIIDLSLLT